MAARTPRRSFATPFVITLAAAPACYVQSTPAPTGPTTTTTTSAPPPTTTTTPDQPPTQGPPTTGPGPVVTNPPMPQTQPPATQTVPGNTKWTVYKTADGCMAAYKVECQPKATCNPPPPFKYECPQNVSLDTSITVASNADGSACFVDYGPTKCPPNTACNPPRPQPVACPKR
jgi:hypothetical protein